jgi:hypothetical protein
MQEGFEEVFGRNRTANLRSPTALAPPARGAFSYALRLRLEAAAPLARKADKQTLSVLSACARDAGAYRLILSKLAGNSLAPPRSFGGVHHQPASRLGLPPWCPDPSAWVPDKFTLPFPVHVVAALRPISRLIGLRAA